MLTAGSYRLFKTLPDPGDAFVDRSSVGFDLGFTRSAEKAETAPLPFEVGPASDKPGFLVIEMREFDLKNAFACAGALAEDLENEPGPVQDLALPVALEVALLDR